MPTQKELTVMLNESLKHCLSEIDFSVCKYLVKAEDCFNKMAALYDSIPDFNIYGKEHSKEVKKYWDFYHKAKEYRNRALLNFKLVVHFCMELDKIFRKKRKVDLYDTVFGDKIKEALVNVMWVSYPYEFGFTKYCFKDFYGMEWLGFEWRSKKDPNVAKNGWYHGDKYYCY